MEMGVEIYQTLHILDGQPLHLAAHLELLSRCYYQLFNSSRSFVESQIRAQVQAVIAQNKPPRGVSLFVDIRLGEDGVLRFDSGARSLYRGYTLRCITPRAMVVDYHIPNLQHPTTARQMIGQLANLEAKRCGYDIALHSPDGRVVDMAGSAPLMAIIDHVVVALPGEVLSVEYGLAIDAAQRLGLRCERRELTLSELHHLDELFYVDHYGITPIKSHLDCYYASFWAEQIAAAMELR